MEGNNFCLQITDAEQARIQPSRDDFEKLRWLSPAEVLNDTTHHLSIRFFAEYVQQHCPPD